MEPYTRHSVPAVWQQGRIHKIVTPLKNAVHEF